MLDEPERSFDLQMQVAIWRLIRAYSAKVQFIVASHSFYALGLPETNYIDMTPGYLELSARCKDLLSLWVDEKPTVQPKSVTE